MSVILTNMDVPSGCYNCEKRYFSECLMNDYIFLNHEYRNCAKIMHPDCPLKSIDGLANYIKQHSYPVRDSQKRLERGMKITDIEQAIKEYCGTEEQS